MKNTTTWEDIVVRLKKRENYEEIKRAYEYAL